MKTVLFHYTGNANIKAVANGLLNQNLLAEFHVAIAAFQGDLIHKIGGLPPFAEIRRRSFNPKLKPYVKTWPLREIGRFIALKAKISSLTEPPTAVFNNDSVNWNIEKKVAKRLKSLAHKGATAVYSSEDGAVYTFREAKKIDMKCIYDLPIGYWRSMHNFLKAERETWPEWADTLTGFKDTKEKLARKDEEISMADYIIVASSFTASTLKEYPGKICPVKIIPYGFPPIGEDRAYDFNKSRPLKLLFVGSLSQRKGIANLFEAIKPLKERVSLTLVGNKASNKCPALDKELEEHNWIPTLPHDKILELMRNHDVLVFPSLFEGFGLVITEAMSQGTPVITTERTAGPDLITHGENGWLIKAGVTDEIKRAIEEILDKPEIVERVGRAASETARLRPWAVYEEELAKAVNDMV